MLKKLIGFAGVLLITSVGTASAEIVKVAGSGGMIPMLNALAKVYMKKNSKDTIDVEQKSLGVEGGLLKVSQGGCDIGMMARALEVKERALPIQGYEIATVLGLFAVHNSVSVKGLNSQQVCDIYAGKIRNWKQVGGKDAPIVVLTRPESESIKKAIRAGIPCFAPLKEGSETITVAKSEDMSTQLASIDNTIGMINSVALINGAGKITALKLDGKDLPSQSLAQWPIYHRFSLVTGKQPSEATKRFMTFIASAEGQAVIRQEKALPIQFKF